MTEISDELRRLRAIRLARYRCEFRTEHGPCGQPAHYETNNEARCAAHDAL